ncbi:MAG: transglycosylase SLT domain-containing protein [Pyrinomonadaceae bacterium]
MTRFLILAFAVICFASSAFGQTFNDRTLADVIAKDRAERGPDGRLQRLSEEDHLFRADVYMSNRQFANAREHWELLMSEYPDSLSIPKALFGMGRSNMWERNYETAVTWFDKLARDFPGTLDGQEGLAFKASCYVRLGDQQNAIKSYEQYTVMYPTGKRIESSYLNILDAYREAGEYEKANEWTEKTMRRFDGLPSATNALHAKLRMDVYRADWNSVIQDANQLISLNKFRDSMAFEYEVRYLKAYAMEANGNKTGAVYEYNQIPVDPASYYSGLAIDRLDALGVDTKAQHSLLRSKSAALAAGFPLKYRTELIRYSKSRGIDPRFVLAIMKQESSFRATAKSPAAARGLLQLTYDTALKYNKKAGFAVISAEDLYKPNVNIAIGSVYISELQNEFGGLYEAIAASYNGGEDNVARWMARTKPKDPAIFTTEVGFSESKRYVYKVMGNFRVYRELYDENLIRIRK